ncbi:MAG TPA: hypothetical protein DEQ47_09950 [Solibacterales bacterium]|nr:hypothetical protein [Bryobacterales bacterium]
MNMPVLDVAIGLSFVYLLLSLMCTTVNEMIAGVFKTRARFLDKGVTRLLGGDDDLKKQLYQHPMIRSLAESDTALCPSYIPADKFATALLDIVSGPGKSLADSAALRDGLKLLKNDHVRGALTAILDKSNNDPASVRLHIQQWFDENMDRVSGWYKRNAQVNAAILACVITLLMNADTVHLASLLWTSPTLRSAMIEQAHARSQKARPEALLPLVEYPDKSKPTASRPINVPEQALSQDEKSQLAALTGWQRERQEFAAWRAGQEGSPAPWRLIARHLLGWLLTAIALSIGAPFWFDTLNRFMNIRNAGRAPDERRDKTQPAAGVV